MYFNNNKLIILYGSQTGNAQDVAERIWRESKRFYFQSSVKAMDEYNVTNLVNDKCVIFVCSTTGQGEEPDNMKSFWKYLLKKCLPSNSLLGLNFAVFGLGDSSYVKFNFVAKRLFRRLQHLGGQSLLPLGLGDDQHDLGHDGLADTWIESLYNKLVSLFPLPDGVRPREKNLAVTPRWKVSTNLLGNFNKNLNRTQSIYYSTRTSKQFEVTLLSNERITDKSYFQDVRLIKLKTSGQEYNPGDVVVLRPKNFLRQVKEIEDVFKSNGINITSETVFYLSETDPEVPVPEVLKSGLTFQQLCEQYFDLMVIPRRFTFNVLAGVTDSELEREKCTEFTLAEGQEDLYNYCNRPKRNIVEVLRDFPNATKKLTKEMLFEVFSSIKPREFSIASNYNVHKNEIHILLAVVKYKTKLVKKRYGLCSNYLANLSTGEQLTVWFKKGSFQFPQEGIPVIMVGPGTGLAPFRNYIFERVYAGTACSKDVLLFFGCRNENKDFHCRDELLELQQQNKISLFCAFSRDQDRKVYVQDKILECKEKVWDMLTRNGYIFIAGNAKSMPYDVRKSFLKVCSECGNMSHDEAEKFILNMERTNKYQTECWS